MVKFSYQNCKANMTLHEKVGLVPKYCGPNIKSYNSGLKQKKTAEVSVTSYKGIFFNNSNDKIFHYCTEA
jgi:hypothetical protein